LPRIWTVSFTSSLACASTLRAERPPIPIVVTASARAYAVSRDLTGVICSSMLGRFGQRGGVPQQVSGEQRRKLEGDTRDCCGMGRE
jgi:hypothetical protein